MSEHQNIEWKESWHGDNLKCICGFANANGGKIYIGKSDKGFLIGIKDHKKLIEDIPNKIISNLGIVCDVNLFKEADKHYIEIIVMPYDVPISYHGKYYYRSGSTKQELKGTALNEFLLRKAGKTWDDIIEPNTTFQDINLNAIDTFKKESVKSKRLSNIENEENLFQMFQNLRLVEGNNLKRAAVLLFGIDPRKFFIGAFIKIGLFGNSDSDLLSQEIIEGNAFELANQTIEILDKKYLKKIISYEGIQRIETPEYPYEAIREILLNAIVHREYIGTSIQISIYNDKFMVWNSGTLPESLKIEDLKRKHASHPRNPILADIFFKGGLIEAWGRGTLKIIDACKKAKLPEPIIEEISGGINVTLFKKKLREDNSSKIYLTDRQKKLISFIKKRGKITNKDYQTLFNVSRETATKDLIRLVRMGILKSSGSKGIGSFYVLLSN